MLHRSRNRARLGPVLGCLIVALTLLASAAHARQERVRWTHPRSDAIDFEVRIRALDGSSDTQSSLGITGLPIGDVYEAFVEVGDGDVEVSLRAVGPGGVLSDWTAAATRLAPPAPDPTVSPGAGTEIPPTAGAEDRFDFASSDLGPRVSGWVSTLPNYSLSADNTLFDVISLGGNRMIHTASNDSAIHTHLIAPPRSNFELRGRMAIDHPDAEIGITTYSGYPVRDEYYRIGRSTGGSFRFVSRPGVSCSSDDSGLVPSAGDWVRFELDVIDEGSRNRIRAKIWRQGDGEPSAPQIDCVDSSAGRPTQGTIGMWAGGPGEKFWDDLEVFQGQSSGGGGGTPTAPPAPPTLLQIVPVEP